MKSKIILLLLLIVISASCSMTFPVAKATIKVVDELGNPIEGAQASIGYQVSKGFMEQGISDVSERGITGADGAFSASHRSSLDIAFSAEKQGYYKSYGRYHFNKSANGHWQPWNPEIKLVLRKIENPVPMYAREFRLEIPVAESRVGFDLIEYDWVKPYGKGTHPDLMFNLVKHVKSRDEFEGRLTVGTFNNFDGIQLLKDDRKYGSDFKLPRFAPDTGYLHEIELIRKREIGKPIETSYSKENNYFIRIRSEEKNGKIIRAMYGKIHGDISFDFSRTTTAIVVFRYYLNPDYSKNLEFEPTKNLFKGLTSLESIGLD